MRAYIGCFGSGLGHAVRMVELAKKLKERGYEVGFSSYGEVVKFIRDNGFVCRRLPPVDVSYSPNGSLSPRATIASFPILFYSSFLQFLYEQRNIKSEMPDVVISDSLPSTVVAGVVSRKNVITFINQATIQPPSNVNTAFQKSIYKGSYSGLSRVWNRSKQIIIPDLPPPYTISERNLSGLDERKVVFVGFLVNPSKNAGKEAELFMKEKKKKVFWSISGPQRTRNSLLREAIKISRQLSDKYFFVISAGNPAGSKLPRMIGNLLYYDWCPYNDFYYSNSDVAITRAGHGTIGQLIYNSCPALLIPIKNQTEQESNASKAARLGFARVVEQERLSKEVVDQEIQTLLSGKFKERAISLSSYLRKLNPWEKCIEIIAKYS